MTPLAGPVLTASETRAAEAKSGVLPEILMERAGSALADAAWRLGNGNPVLVLCGPGNNGGDGYVAARVLAARGVNVAVAATGHPHTAIASAARTNWTGRVEAISSAAPRSCVIDAVFGTGLSRRLSDELADVLSKVLGASHLAIAADLPSGVGSDDGAALGATRCNVTLALGVAKPAHLLQPSASLCGHVLLADIGIAATSETSIIERPSLRAPLPTDHKFSRGMVAVVPGAMAGAATLGVTAAARIAGYTVLCGKAEAPASVVRRGFDATLADSRLGAMLIGPGLSDTSEARQKLAAALGSCVPLVLDAGALGLIDPALRRTAATVLTPHEGEFAKLFGDLGGSKIDRARVAAARSGATIVLKGSDTVVASPDGRVSILQGATAWLATAGTGDVLAGIIAAMLSRGLGPHEAACAGVWVHAGTARLAGPALIADDLPRHLASALATCR